MPTASFGSASVRWPRFDRTQLIRRLKERLPALEAVLPLQRVVLFGSQAIGRATASSDVDLLVVSAGPPDPDAYHVVHRTLDVPGLEPHVYAAGEAESIRDVIQRMSQDGVALYDAADIGSD